MVSEAYLNQSTDLRAWALGQGLVGNTPASVIGAIVCQTPGLLLQLYQGLPQQFLLGSDLGSWLMGQSLAGLEANRVNWLRLDGV